MPASPFSLENKIAIVTGGGVGIGRSVAVEFARAGADVVVASRKLENLEPVTAEIKTLGRRSFAMAVDVRQEDAVKELVERTVRDLGRLDIMVNNAGASFRANPEDITANGWNTVVQINLNGVFFGCKWAGRQMMAQGGGVIINVSSIAGTNGSAMMPHYGAAKAAVVNYTRSLGMAWGRKNVRVNCIAPGPIESLGLRNYPEELVRRIHLGNPMKAMGDVWDVAQACVYLEAPTGKFITGEVLTIDGGMQQWGGSWPLGVPDYFNVAGA